MFQSFRASPLDLTGGRAYFFGDHRQDAQAALAVERDRIADDNPILWHRAPTHVVREFVESPDYQTIGGDVLLGFVQGLNFTRAATVMPRVRGEPEAVMRLNNIDLDQIGRVGPCLIGITGMLGA